MRDGLKSEDGPGFGVRSTAAAYRPTMALVAGAMAALISMAVCAAAILVPAPVGAVPFVVAICVGCPLFAGWEVAPAIASRRADRARHRALASLRATLDRLPETEHPLGL